MRILTIANFKGGVAKTTTSINMAYILAEKGYDTLLIDADPQGNSSYFFSQYSDSNKTMLDVLTDKCDIKKAIKRTKYKHLDILPSNILLESLSNVSEDALLLKLRQVDLKYDFAVIDCQPSFQVNTINALVAADDLIVPVKIDRFGLNGLELMKDQLDEIHKYNENLNFIGCLVTMYRATRSNNKGIMELVERNQYPECNTVIRYAEAVNNSTFARKPLIKHRRLSNATVDYKALVEEYLGKVEK